MKTSSSKRFLTLLLSGAIAALTPQWAQAAGTPACTSIANTASVNYKVGSVDQAQVDGVANPFIVGNKVRLDVVTSDVSPGVTVLQGGTNGVLTFTVTNTGNKVQDYALAPVNVATAGTAFGGAVTDEFDAGVATAYVESGATVGYQSGEDLATFIDELDPTVTYPNEGTAGTKTVYVVVAGPVPPQSNGDNALYGLVATTHRGGTAGGAIGALVINGEIGACSEDTVFADLAASTGPDDGNLDGADSDRSGLVVSAAATLEVSKTSAVYSDPINGTTGAKAIPGAVVTYTITITNPAASTATASSVSISDSLNGEIGAGHLAFQTLYDDGSTICAAGQGIVVDGVCKTNASAADDNVDWNVTAANTVTVTGLSLAPNTSKVIKFQVTIP